MRGLLIPWRVERLIAMSRHATDLVKIFPDHKKYNIEFINADIATTTEIPKADYVIHAAASTDLRDYLSKPESEKTTFRPVLIIIANLHSCFISIVKSSTQVQVQFMVYNQKLLKKCQSKASPTI